MHMWKYGEKYEWEIKKKQIVSPAIRLRPVHYLHHHHRHRANVCCTPAHRHRRKGHLHTHTWPVHVTCKCSCLSSCVYVCLPMHIGIGGVASARDYYRTMNIIYHIIRILYIYRTHCRKFTFISIYEIERACCRCRLHRCCWHRRCLLLPPLNTVTAAGWRCHYRRSRCSHRHLSTNEQ